MQVFFSIAKKWPALLDFKMEQKSLQRTGDGAHTQLERREEENPREGWSSTEKVREFQTWSVFKKTSRFTGEIIFSSVEPRLQ